MEAADLQFICLFKHKASGDTYQGAATETDKHLGGLLSALRNRGGFVGELGETFLFTPTKGSIPAKRFMIIGLGEEKDLSLDSLRLVGRKATQRLMSAKATAPLPNNCCRHTTRRNVSRHRGLRPSLALRPWSLKLARPTSTVP